MTIYEISYNEYWVVKGQKKGSWNFDHKNISASDVEVAVTKLRKRLIGGSFKTDDGKDTVICTKLKITEVKALAETN